MNSSVYSASENSRIFLISRKSGNERLVSWWRKKMMKAGAIGRLGNMAKLLQRQARDSH